MAPVEVHIYVDVSKVLAIGQRVYAKAKGLNMLADATWRLDVGNLLEVLRTESRLPGDERDYDFQFHLFGLTPPPVDTIWLAMDDYNVRMSRFARPKWTGRELLFKEAVSYASSAHYRRAPCEIILAANHQGLVPSVDEIREAGAPVHIWLWKEKLSPEYAKLQNSDRHVRISLLDDYLERIGYAEPTLYAEQSSINPNSIVILDALSSLAEVRRVLSDLMIRLHAYIYEPRRTDSTSKDLVVAPALARGMSYEQIEDFYETAKHKFELSGIRTMALWLYRSTYFDDEETGARLVVYDQFTRLPTEEHDDDPDNTKQQRKASSGRCYFRQHCARGLECPYGHSESELEHFKNNPPEKTRKTRRCHFGRKCPQGDKCGFAHTDSELFCPTCGKTGHPWHNCHQRNSLD